MNFYSSLKLRQCFLRLFRTFNPELPKKLILFIDKSNKHLLLIDVYNSVIKNLPYKNKKPILLALINKNILSANFTKMKLMIFKEAFKKRDTELLLIRYSNLPNKITNQVVKWVERSV